LSKGVSTSKANSENMRSAERLPSFYNKWICERGKVYHMYRAQCPPPLPMIELGRIITTCWKKRSCANFFHEHWGCLTSEILWTPPRRSKFVNFCTIKIYKLHG